MTIPSCVPLLPPPGALLIWFGVSISHDWLILSFTKMTRTGGDGASRKTLWHMRVVVRGRVSLRSSVRPFLLSFSASRGAPPPPSTCAEYGLLLATFGAIMQWGLEGGILAGIVLATLYFAAAYAQSQVQAIRVAEGARSSVVRTVEQQVGGRGCSMWRLGARARVCRCGCVRQPGLGMRQRTAAGV